MSDWRVIDNPVLPPQACISCGRAAGVCGPVIDTGPARTIILGPQGGRIVMAGDPDMGGRVYICLRCVKLAAVLAELLDDEEAEERLNFRVKLAGLEREIGQRDERDEKLRANLEASAKQLTAETERADTAEQRIRQLEDTLTRVREDAAAVQAVAIIPAPTPFGLMAEDEEMED